jgi:hypothetical protein
LGIGKAIASSFGFPAKSHELDKSANRAIASHAGGLFSQVEALQNRRLSEVVIHATYAYILRELSHRSN